VSEHADRDKKTRLFCSDGFMIFYNMHISLSPRLKATMKIMMM